MDVMEKAMPHMRCDEAHREHIDKLSETTGESQEEWMSRMQQLFDDKAED